VLQPKVDGTWNLHRQFESVELDFFVLFSSISGIVGQWGQANYSSANTFLDAFVRYRRSLNLAASVIDIGIMADVGYVSQNQAFLEQFRASGFHTLDEQDLLTALHIAINNSHPGRTHDDAVAELSQFAIGLRSTKPLDDPGNRTTWKRDIRMAMFRSMELTSHQNVSSTSADLKQFLSSVAANPTILDLPESLGVLTREIGRTIYSFMLRSEEDMDVSQSLTTIGVDSLVSIEIRNWWKRSLGLEISVLEIMTSGSIARLGEVAVERLRAKHLVLVV
jgi:aryl carrier-like protein